MNILIIIKKIGKYAGAVATVAGAIISVASLSDKNENPKD